MHRPAAALDAVLLSLSVATLAMLIACAPADRDASPDDDATKLELLVPGSSFHGVHGLIVTADGRLLAGSVVGQAIYLVSPETGAVSEWIGPPQGEADDLAEGPNGRLAWTSFLAGKVHARTGGAGPVEVIAEGLPAANSLDFAPDGRLFVTQVFGGDALWEVDPEGVAPPRKVAENLGGLNGFDFGPDGMIYGPIWFGSKVVRVDPETGAMTTVADGFATPAAVNFDPAGNLYAIDTERGEVVRIDPASGEKTIVATLPPSLDNLAFAADGRMFVSNMARAAIYEVDTESGETRTVVEGELAMPAGIALWEDAGEKTLHLADTFAYRTIDASTGDVTDVRSMFAQSTDELDYPVWASVDDDHVILASWTSGTVQIVDRRSGQSHAMLHGFAAPAAAVELPDGRLAVAEVGSDSLIVCDALGEQRRTIVAGLSAPVGMIRGSEGKVLVTSAGAGALLEIELENGALRTVAAGLALPEGLALMPDGRVVVAEVGARRLVAVSLVDGAVEVLAEGLPVGLPAPAGLPPAFVPTGVAVDAAGTVYVTSDLENAIYKLEM
jgi:sugar lactone lactonase YvrE